MEGDQSIELIHSLLLGDLEDLEHQQKGKQVAGRLTDLQHAVMSMRTDILAAQASNSDRTLALSTSTAIATDQSVLALLQHEERVAEQDRRAALALDEGEPTYQEESGPSASGKAATADRDIDAVFVVMGNLMDRMALDDTPTDEKRASPEMSSPQTASSVRQCASCFETCVSTIHMRRCGHEFCKDCTRQMFLGAIKDEELYPPRCCGNVLPPEVALRILDYGELRDFCEGAIEWTAKDRVYCAEPTCSKFIPPWAIQDDHGTCPQCQRQTHLPCRSFAHPDVDCSMDRALQDVLQLADTEHWTRCFNCRAMVELQHGCNHITCR